MVDVREGFTADEKETSLQLCHAHFAWPNINKSGMLLGRGAGHCSWPVHCNEDVVTGVCLITNIGVWYYGQTASTGTCSCKHTIWTSDDGHIIMACTLALALLSHKNSVVFTIGHIDMLSRVVAVSTVHIVLLSCSSGPVFQFQSIAQLKVEIVHLSFHKILHCTKMNILLFSHLFLHFYRY